MAKVVVTGGSGKLGGHVVTELLKHGYDALSLDKIPPQDPRCASWIVDLRDSGGLYQALNRAEGLIHLGAYARPGLVPDTETFSNNIAGTYNLLKAAADMNIKRVVVASSVAAFGFLYAPRFWLPDYLPLDEDHPCKPQDPYGLSKLLGETIAEGFAASHSMAIISIRFPGVNFDLSYSNFSARWKEPGARLGGFWSYIDARDAAAACRSALELNFTGHKVLNVAAHTSTMKEPTDELMRRFAPGVRKARPELTGNWSGMNSAKAEDLLGFKAQHTWQRYLTI